MADYYGEKLNNGYHPERISFRCLTLGLIFALVLGCLPIVPEQLTKFMRPAFIAAVVMFAGEHVYPLAETRWQLLSLCYYSIIFVTHDITNNAINVYISMALFILFLIFAAREVWNKKEIFFLLILVVVSCDIESIIVAIFNEGVFGHVGARMYYFGQTINRNTFGFTVVPGCLCSLVLLLYESKNVTTRKKLFYAVSFLLCAFMVFATGCRSAFYSAAAGILLITFEKIQDDKSYQERFFKKILLVLFVLLIAYLLTYAAGDSYSSRLFDVSDSSGRDAIWEKAWELIWQKPVFGGGYDYWINYGVHQGTHNSFILILLYSGFTGLFFVVMFFLATVLQCLKAKNYIALALLIEAILHSYTETSMDYYAYIPIILTFVLLRYTQRHSCKISELFN